MVDKGINQRSALKIEKDHPLYHLKRMVWNLNIDQYPAVIFECKNEREVVDAVHYALNHGLKITVRGGGFHPAGKSVMDEAVLIDLSHMNNVQIDEVSKIATVEAGARTFEVDNPSQEYGLATPLGIVSNLGVSGTALGGGIGYLRGLYGLTSDNIVGVHIVTGDGQLLYVNQFEHPELFWAVRGAGSNYGVVTKFEFKLHPVGRNVLGLDVVYDFKDLHEIMNKVEVYRQTAVDEIAFNIVLTNKQPDTNEPDEKLVYLYGMYTGELNLYVEEQIIQPLIELATPIEDNVEVMTYMEMQSKYDKYLQGGVGVKGISLFFNEINNQVLDILTSEFEKTDLRVVIQIVELHGQVNRIPLNETAFAIRDASYLMLIDAEVGTNPDEAEDWILHMYQKLLPYSYNQISYLNCSLVNEDIIKNSYSNIIERLVALKKEYDPNNLFASNHKLIE
ncbi:FAD-dependent oxidoreductase [Ornithinibacillus halotolerans]|uniref:FAD-linked oxidase n=1 Tax=Ornithinibacillus halotolerans TaxID=1274357 RepID=A0A916W4N8_9BACI|nr:FAD-binding oxidoreductase [Ornithinibacillus halotolerans]GGA65863.1 FAD-linked oxidase [Ornithinibacillus halotolerans]